MILPPRRALRVAAVLSVLAAAGCREQMTVHVENHGSPLVSELSCGDSMNEIVVPAGGRTSLAPRANACTLMIESPMPGRSLDVDVVCKATTCSFGVEFPMGSGAPSATLTRDGSIHIVGNVATVVPK